MASAPTKVWLYLCGGFATNNDTIIMNAKSNLCNFYKTIHI